MYGKETDLIYEGIATSGPLSTLGPLPQQRNWPDLRRDCDNSYSTHNLNPFTKETDLIYEGIATVHPAPYRIYVHIKETDLIYEGIATS